jgi:transposase
MEAPMDKRDIVRLSSAERERFAALIKKGKAAAYKILPAHILLKTDAAGPDWSAAQVAEAFGCHSRTVANVRQRLGEEGVEAALERKKREIPPRQRKLNGAAAARLMARSCSHPPEGRAGWTLQMLADELVVLGIVEEISGQTVRRTLKKTPESRICVNAGSFPRSRTRRLWPIGRMCWQSTSGRLIRPCPKSAWLNSRSS